MSSRPRRYDGAERDHGEDGAFWGDPVAGAGVAGGFVGLGGYGVDGACIIGMIYASLVAIKQDDLKRLIAYSSIAHVGLMCLAIFATTESGMQGVMIQMFNHGINILGMWIVVDLIERQFGHAEDLAAGRAGAEGAGLAILLVVVALANVALPLTNAFIGEFLLFSGVFTRRRRSTMWCLRWWRGCRSSCRRCIR
jgi:NADH:ubiquinone oxidoreductase subunit 4 (subunit M)